MRELQIKKRIFFNGGQENETIDMHNSSWVDSNNNTRPIQLRTLFDNHKESPLLKFYGGLFNEQ